MVSVLLQADRAVQPRPTSRHRGSRGRSLYRASTARARPFTPVRGGSSAMGWVPVSTTPFIAVPLASTDNAEVGGSIPPSPTESLVEGHLSCRDRRSTVVLWSLVVLGVARPCHGIRL